jgi:peptidoglycan/LPS O-acetylase OafA/YrhL
MKITQSLDEPKLEIASAPDAQLVTSTAMPFDGGRIAALDGVRGLAIIMVMVCHFTVILGLSTRIESMFLFVTSRLGIVGVELFFVLSGFLITGILWDSKARTGREKLRIFYARRILRIFPLYYGVIFFLTLSGFLIPRLATPGWHRFLGNEKYLLIYATNIVMAIHGEAFVYDWFDLGHFWTLAIEEHFYLFWPWLLLWSNRRGIIMVCGILLLASLGLQIWAVPRDGSLLLALMSTPRQAGSLIIGSALALAMRDRRETHSILKVSMPLMVVCFVGFAVLFANEAFGIPALKVLERLLTGIMFACLIARVRGGVSIERAIFESRFLCFFGKYSYGLYVFHALFFPVWVSLVKYLDYVTGIYRLAALLMFCIATLVSIALSLLSWSLFERPILSLKRYFEYD